MTDQKDGGPDDLPAMHEAVWTCLLRGLRDREAPARHPTCATVGPDGWPEARTLVLRGADRPEATLDLHTDALSAKLAALAAAPRLALHVWDAGPRLQLRLRCGVEVLGDAALLPDAVPARDGPERAALWDGVPDASRGGYGSVPPPGTPLDGALAYSRQPDPRRFVVLRCRVLAIDALHLGAEHRRARFDRADGWAGQWIAP